MQIKAPKGDIFGWSIFWFVCGMFLVVVAPWRGETTLTVLGALLAISAALIWLNQKWIAPVLMIFYSLGGLGRLLLITKEGITLYGLAKLVMPFYFVYILWQWYRSESSEGAAMQVADLDEPTYRAERRDAFAPTSQFDTPTDDGHSSNPYQENRRDEL